MAEKYFMHRIQKVSGAYTKGIEIHDTLDAAVLSFWGRLKTGYGASQGTEFVHCKITDESGAVVQPYDMAWNADEEYENTFFLHHVRLDGGNYDKGIDICESFNAARAGYAAAMEYGYNNPNHPDVTYVSCEITDRSGSVMTPFDETWPKQQEPAQAGQE